MATTRNTVAQTRKPLAPEVIAQVRTLAESGTARAATILGIGEESVLRILAGTPVLAGTALVVAQALGRISRGE